MGRISVELKAKCPDRARVRKILRSRRAVRRGLDRQVDTYFRVPDGRLKLREGNIENALIFYRRPDRKSSKICEAVLYRCPDPRALKKILEAAFGILVIVEKQREIFWIGNAKFHIDRVKKLGSFVEVEVFGRKTRGAIPRLEQQCGFYKRLFGIKKRDLLADSYSDQLIRLQTAD